MLKLKYSLKDANDTTTVVVYSDDNGDSVVKKFPNNECKIVLPNIEVQELSSIDIVLEFEGNKDLMDLFFIKKQLDAFYGNKIDVNLEMPYVPYSRQDRESLTSGFTLKYFCKFINDLNFANIYVHSPHSDVCMALLDRVHDLKRFESIVQSVVESENYILFPDAGAQKRYSDLFKSMDHRIMVANKHRDLNTGKISNMSIDFRNVDKEEINSKYTYIWPDLEMQGRSINRIVYIIDDLCSYGGTFITAAKAIKKDYPNVKVVLLVGHAEKSILQGDICRTNWIDRVYFHNSLLTDIEIYEFGNNKLHKLSYFDKIAEDMNRPKVVYVNNGETCEKYYIDYDKKDGIL